jgi:hypothetical protein
VADSIARYGAYAAVIAAIAIVVVWLSLRFARKRLEKRL